jgi:uncharacterized membrane protein YcaP (DUF421 family)
MTVSAGEIFGFGRQPGEMTLLQMSARAVVVFFSALVLIRIADKRFLANKTGFDMLFALVLGSSLSRAINGTAPLFNTIAVAFIIVIIHRALAKIAYHSHFICRLLKGHSEIIIKDGELNRAVMARNDITEADITEDMRLKTNINEFTKVREARIERNGEISVLPILKEEKL